MQNFDGRQPEDVESKQNREQMAGEQMAEEQSGGGVPADMSLVRIDSRGNIIRHQATRYRSSSESRLGPDASSNAYASPNRADDLSIDRDADDRDADHHDAGGWNSFSNESGLSQSGLVERRGSPRWRVSTPVDAPVLTDPIAATHVAAANPKARRNDSMTGPLAMLATMTVMLLAARFVVPYIVEEVRYSWHRGELRAEYEMAGDGLKNVSLSALSQAYQMVTSAVGPSVVHLDVSRESTLPSSSTFGQYASPDSRGGFGQRSEPIVADQGSGVVVDKAGYILTNEHVVKGGGRIVVTLSDGRRRDAVVVGVDTLTDLAVLKIDADGLMPIVWGDSDDCRVGSPVWAVGSPFGLDRTVTFGILSGKHRMVRANTAYQDFMQSDVAVNPGNSGGPLVDADGHLVGINTAILGDFYQGVSFSIPSKVAKQIYQSIRDNGVVQRAWLGVMLASVPDNMLIGENSRQRGALVGGLAAIGSPAGRAGVIPGDIILKFEGVPIDDTSHLMRLVGSEAAGNVVTLDVSRRGEPMQIEVSLGAKE